MNYQSLYDYCHDISQSLGISVKWVHTNDVNFLEITPDQPITCWSVPFMSNGSDIDGQITRTWTLKFIFYQQDKADGSMNQNDQSAQQESIKTLASTDEVAERYLRLFNENNISTELSNAADILTINSYSTEPAIRDTSHQLTGTVLTIVAEFPDNFDYCCLTGV